MSGMMTGMTWSPAEVTLSQNLGTVERYSEEELMRLQWKSPSTSKTGGCDAHGLLTAGVCCKLCQWFKSLCQCSASPCLKINCTILTNGWTLDEADLTNFFVLFFFVLVISLSRFPGFSKSGPELYLLCKQLPKGKEKLPIYVGFLPTKYSVVL